MIITYVIGSAGSGKTLFTLALKTQLTYSEENIISVNLDPAVKKTPYSPEVDIRDYVNIDNIVFEEEVGPNAALMLSYEKATTVIDQIIRDINYYSPEVVIIDTPGQLELFILKKVGLDVINSLRIDKQLAFYLIDSHAALDAEDLITQLLLATICHFRLKMPIYLVLSKTDLVTDKEVDILCERIKKPSELLKELNKKHEVGDIDLHTIRYLETYEGFGEVLPTSALAMKGFDNVYLVIDSYKNL